MFPDTCKHIDPDLTRCPNDATSALENGYCITHEDEDWAKDVTPYGGEALLKMRGRLFDGQPYERG